MFVVAPALVVFPVARRYIIRGFTFATHEVAEAASSSALRRPDDTRAFSLKPRPWGPLPDVGSRGYDERPGS
jgi:hypothetical protein